MDDDHRVIIFRDQGDILISTVDGETHFGKGTWSTTHEENVCVDTTKPHMKAAFNGVITIYSGANNPICSFDPEKGKWYYNDKPMSQKELENIYRKLKIQGKPWGRAVYNLIQTQAYVTTIHKSLQYEHKNSDGKMVYCGQRPIKDIKRPLYGEKFGVDSKVTGYFEGNDPENLTRLNYDKAPVIEAKDPKVLLMELRHFNNKFEYLLSSNCHLKGKTNETLMRLLNLEIQKTAILYAGYDKVKDQDLPPQEQQARYHTAFTEKFTKKQKKAKSLLEAVDALIPPKIIPEQIASEEARYERLKQERRQPQDSSYGGQASLGRLQVGRGGQSRGFPRR